MLFVIDYQLQVIYYRYELFIQVDQKLDSDKVQKERTCTTMNTQQQLSPELITLLQFLTNSSGHHLVELGDGIICFYGPRQHPDGRIPCTVAFDPQKWMLGNTGDKIAKPWQRIIQFQVKGIGGDGTEIIASEPDIATGFIRLLLHPRHEGLQFYTMPKGVTFNGLIGLKQDPLALD